MRGSIPAGDPAEARRKRKRADGNCRATGKLSYRTRKKAIKAPRPDGQRQEPYVCRACGEWHLYTP